MGIINCFPFEEILPFTSPDFQNGAFFSFVTVSSDFFVNGGGMMMMR
jgi:hypothetical protein